MFLLVIATVLAGALGPMQAAVNGKLGQTIGDGHAAALISFGVGLVFMFIVVFSRQTTRRQALAVPGQIRARTIPWWNYLAGLCGAVIVLSEGVTVGVLGVATFQISLMSGLVISGLVCDRLGVTASGKQPLTTPRLIGAVMTIMATVIVISPNFSVPSTIILAIMPFVGGLLAGWQPAGNAAVADVSGSMLVSIGWNFLVGFAALLLAYGIRAVTTGVSLTLPSEWWMYLGGPLGLLSIALMAILVRRLGLLLLGLASVAGQLVGSVILDAAIPSLGHAIHAATIIGTIVALVAAAIGMIPSKKNDSLTTAAAVGGGEAGEVGPR
ncbi:transporter family-2 protein [Sanguibacter gelidistatuariae]|uniref:Transporter family-2 protein n=1 Tax=Sanguibacter gelidistatuariae TaxID=1814289 RepID=A0A1G6XL72_9MICO|nr:DMT family transporter [Sanguibacter gelidistatuariae]SDD78792.1 transporter family-2 protein [Sanguibacter gelidistatuariae]